MRKSESKKRFDKSNTEEKTGYSFTTYWGSLKISEKLVRKIQWVTIEKIASELSIEDDIEGYTREDSVNFIENYIETIICDCENHIYNFFNE